MDIGLKGGDFLRRNIHSIWFIIFVLCLSGLSPIRTTKANGNNVIITSNQTNLREGPGLSYQKIGQANRGDKFPILKESGDWIQIQLQSNKKGWVANWLVTYEQSSSSSSNLNKGETASVTTDGLRVRSGPGTNYKVLHTLNSGTKVEVSEVNGDWVKITFSGNKGWVSSQYIDTKPKDEKKKQASESSSSVKDIGMGTVTATTLYVREEGALDGDIVAKVKKGDQYKVLDEVNNWIKIEYTSGSYGWVASWFIEKSAKSPTNSVSKKGSIEILYDGTNIRKKPNVQSEVVIRANQGDTFETTTLTNDWYEIKLDNGGTAYVAGWVVQNNDSVQQVEKTGSEVHLKNKTIVVDPGHGGKDSGTEGYKGTSEKNVTLQTAMLLSNKLKAAGANVIMTRSNDSFLSLSSRVRLSHYHAADAFISIHYDSIDDKDVKGTTTFYNHPFQKPLAASIHSAVLQNIDLKDRGVRYGDYHVLRENKRDAVLLELGYLSNPTEEKTIITKSFQEKAATGIYQGLAKYFTK
jgi:N-acetylmuramoyl-L-alanine amidase